MNVDIKTYLTIGYDLSNFRDEILTNDFCDSEEYENLAYGECDNYKLFVDGMCGDYLYYGYVLGNVAEYHNDFTVIENEKLQNIISTFYIIEPISNIIKQNNLKLQIMLFNEYT